MRKSGLGYIFRVGWADTKAALDKSDQLGPVRTIEQVDINTTRFGLVLRHGCQINRFYAGHILSQLLFKTKSFETKLTRLSTSNVQLELNCAALS